MIKFIVAGVGEFEVDKLLEGYKVQQKPSSNVEFFGYNDRNGLFVQFKSGSTYLYENIETEVLQELDQAESVGQFLRKRILNSYPFTRFDGKMIKPFIPVAKS